MKLYPILFVLLFACKSEVKEIDQKKSINSDTLTNNILPDSLLVGELIDGPANVRDTVNGKLIFVLNDNIPVATTDTSNKWIQVGIIADVTSTQFKALALEKGDKILLEGIQVGTALERMVLSAGLKTNQGLKAELIGYTSIQNIKPVTIPEYALAKMINPDQVPALDKFLQFFKKAGFHKSDSEHFDGFLLEENWINDPSPLIRLWVLFNDNKLFGVVHSRKLNISNSETIKLKREFSLTTIGNQNQKKMSEFVEEFNLYIESVD